MPRTVTWGVAGDSEAGECAFVEEVDGDGGGLIAAAAVAEEEEETAR